MVLHHFEVDRIWAIQGIYYGSLKKRFYLFQNGCKLYPQYLFMAPHLTRSAGVSRPCSWSPINLEAVGVETGEWFETGVW